MEATVAYFKVTQTKRRQKPTEIKLSRMISSQDCVQKYLKCVRHRCDTIEEGKTLEG